MSLPIIVSLCVLVAIFVIASRWDINIGTLAFPGVLLVAICAQLDVETVFEGFPTELFVVVVGITYLFGIAESNGTVGWILDRGLRLVRGHVAVLPALFFVLAFVVSAVGAVGTATVAMTMPIAMSCAYRYRLNPFLLGMSVVCGMQAGYFSPIAVYSVTVLGILRKAGLTASPGPLFLTHLALNVGLAAVIYVCCRGWRGPVSTTGAVAVNSEDQNSQEAEPTRRAVGYRWATLGGLMVLLFGILVFQLNAGLLAFGIGVLLMLVFARGEDKTYVAKVSWPTVMMLCGVLTYVSVMDAIGTLDVVGEALGHFGDSRVAILAISYLTAITSAFASSIGTMSATVPLAVPILLDDPTLGVLGPITTITASTYLVDPSPLSILGALMLANTRRSDHRRMFRTLVLWALAMVVAAPVVTWLVAVVIV